MSSSPDRNPESDPLDRGIQFLRKIFTDNETNILFGNLDPENFHRAKELRDALRLAFDTGDREQSTRLLEEIPRVRGSILARVIKAVKLYPPLLAIALDLMTDEEMSVYADYILEHGENSL